MLHQSTEETPLLLAPRSPALDMEMANKDGMKEIKRQIWMLNGVLALNHKNKFVTTMIVCISLLFIATCIGFIIAGIIKFKSAQFTYDHTKTHDPYSDNEVRCGQNYPLKAINMCRFWNKYPYTLNDCSAIAHKLCPSTTFSYLSFLIGPLLIFSNIILAGVLIVIMYALSTLPSKKYKLNELKDSSQEKIKDTAERYAVEIDNDSPLTEVISNFKEKTEEFRFARAVIKEAKNNRHSYLHRFFHPEDTRDLLGAILQYAGIHPNVIAESGLRIKR